MSEAELGAVLQALSLGGFRWAEAEGRVDADLSFGNRAAGSQADDRQAC